MKRTMALACLTLAVAACGSSSDDNGAPPPVSDAGIDSGSDRGPSGDGTIAVDGRLFDVTGRMPFARVWIPGQSPTTTDGTGQFHFDGVKPPYDLVVLRQNSEAIDGVIVQQVTRPDPTILFTTPKQGDVKHASSVAGTATFPSPPSGEIFHVTFDSPERPDTSETATPDGNYSISAAWFGPTETKGAVYGLRLAGDPPTAYDYGVVYDVTLGDQVPVTGQSLRLSETKTGSLSGTIAPAPAGFTLADYAVDLAVSDHGLLPIARVAAPSAGLIAHTTPALVGTQVLLRLSATKGAQQTSLRKSVDANTKDVQLALPLPPELTAPADGANDVAESSALTWTAKDPGVSTVDVSVSDPKLHFQILTSGSATSWPDLSPLGVVFPKGATFTWSVAHCTPAASVDELLDGRWDPHPRCEGTATSPTWQAKTVP